MKIHNIKSKSYTPIGALFVLAAFLTACSGTTTDPSISTTPRLGLSAGGSIWSKTNAKYADLANGPISGEIGTQLSGAAKKQAIEAEYRALENSTSSEPVLWQYSNTQNGKISTFPPYQVGSSNCRRYIHTVSVHGVSNQAAGTACRSKDGIWTPLT